MMDLTTRFNQGDFNDRDRPAALLAAAWLAVFLMPATNSSSEESSGREVGIHIMGATETLTELSTGLEFRARVDTGAESSSVNCREFEIEDEVDDRLGNVGKKIRFRLVNQEGKSAWSEGTVASAVRVTTGEGVGRRYKVRLKLRWEGFEKEVEVSLNDRSKLEYPLLIGRNWLKGDFLVDVARKSDDD